MESQPSESVDVPQVSGSIDDVSRALEFDQLFLVYQPEFDLQSNAFVGVESLIRWRHPQHGVVNPDEFLPILEVSGQIIPVGRWALQTACRQGAEWHDKGYRFSVSVNISERQFESPELLSEVDDALSANRFSSTHLVLEFSQSVLTTPRGEERLNALRSLGVRVAIDDIDLDHFDVADIVKSTVDIVKLDRHFIAKVTDVASAELVHSLVRLAREHSIQVVAAGIEDADQRELLKMENVGVGQGFHLSIPREAVDIDQLLLDFSIFSGEPI